MRRHGADHLMLIVDSISVDLTDPAEPVARGGTAGAFDPWQPRQDEPTEKPYTWRLGADR